MVADFVVFRACCSNAVLLGPECMLPFPVSANILLDECDKNMFRAIVDTGIFLYKNLLDFTSSNEYIRWMNNGW